MIWAHSINPLAMAAAILFIVVASAVIAGFGLWVLYCLWLERTGEQPDYAIRLLRRVGERVTALPAAAAALMTGVVPHRQPDSGRN